MESEREDRHVEFVLQTEEWTFDISDEGELVPWSEERLNAWRAEEEASRAAVEALPPLERPMSFECFGPSRRPPRHYLIAEVRQ